MLSLYFIIHRNIFCRICLYFCIVKELYQFIVTLSSGTETHERHLFLQMKSPSAQSHDTAHAFEFFCYIRQKQHNILRQSNKSLHLNTYNQQIVLDNQLNPQHGKTVVNFQLFD